MNNNDDNIIVASKTWVRKEKDKIIKKIVRDCKKVEERYLAHSIFMAGSPGAGKTEFSKRLATSLNNHDLGFVRIDADEIRTFIPMYDGSNSSLIQPASTLGVDKVHDYVLHNNINFILDTTLGSYGKSKNNIDRSLSRKRLCEITYIYQDPIKSWELTKAREEKEGRKIPKDAFVREFFAANKNVKLLKSEFGNKLNIDIITRDYESNLSDHRFGVKLEEIDNLVKIKYSPKELINILS